MININDKTKCCGCTACANICPKNCITMEADDEGFLYPVVDENKCIKCGLCEKVCPIVHKTERMSCNSEVYAIQLKDKTALKECASGGFYAALSQFAVEQGGIIWGAVYDKDFHVVHAPAETDEECKAFRGSKYVQSNLGMSYRNVKEALEINKLVCFSGTPCQIEGLKKYLGKDYENLLTVDLVCAGVPSPKLWDEYIDMQQKNFDSPLKYANFRYKTYGYQCSTMRLEFENSRIYSKSGRIDPMMYFFVNGIAKRPICYECPFKGVNRVSDFTIFDGWHAAQLAGIKDNDRGFTFLIAHSVKGKKVLERLQKYIDCYRVNKDNAILCDGIMLENQPKRNNDRDKFYKVLNSGGLNECMKQFMHLSVQDYLLEALKPVLYKSGIIRLAKKVRKRLHR